MMLDLPSLGWGDHFSAAYARHDRPDREPARVTTVDQGVYGLLTATGPVRASIGGGLLAAASRDRQRLPCAGDWVVLRSWPDDRVTLEAVLPRRTSVVWPAGAAPADSQFRVANVDVVAVVARAVPEPDPVVLRRRLALVREPGVTAVLVLTDLGPSPVTRPTTVDTAGAVLVSRRGHGVERLRALVAGGRTLALVGDPGSGKSTVVNLLAGATVMPIRYGRRADRPGRPETVRQALVALPGGGAVVDTPGFLAVAAGRIA